MGHRVNATSFRLRNTWENFGNFKELKKGNNNLKNLQLKEYITSVCSSRSKLLFDFRMVRSLNTILVFFSIYPLDKRINSRKNFYSKRKYERLKDILTLRMKYYSKLDYYGVGAGKMDIKCFFRKKHSYRRRLLQKDKQFLYKNKFYKDFSYMFDMVGVSFKTQSVDLLAKGIAFFFKKTRRQLYFLNLVQSILLHHYVNQVNNFRVLGFKVEIHGKINGKARKKKKIIFGGSMPLNTINANIKYRFIKIPSKFGIFGLRVWLFLSNKSFYRSKFFNFKRFKRFLEI